MRQQKTLASATYTFDGDSLRVRKLDSQNGANNRLYWRGTGVQVLVESDLAGNSQKELVYFNGALLAYFDNGGSTVQYYYADRMGSVRAITDTSGATTEWTASYYPWGQVASGNQAGLDNRYRWVGQEYDSELQTYYFPYRTYSPSLGRFFSVDPMPGMDTNPQTNNRYTYVANKGVNDLDPLGLYDMVDDGFGDFGGGGGGGDSTDQQTLNGWSFLPGRQNIFAQTASWETQYSSDVNTNFDANTANADKPTPDDPGADPATPENTTTPGNPTTPIDPNSQDSGINQSPNVQPTPPPDPGRSPSYANFIACTLATDTAKASDFKDEIPAAVAFVVSAAKKGRWAAVGAVATISIVVIDSTLETNKSCSIASGYPSIFQPQ